MFSTRAIMCSFVFSLYLASSSCNHEVYKPAPNCAHLECPEYTVVESQKDFEIRSYKETTWSYSPSIYSKSYEKAASQGFKLLADYFEGENVQQMKINMTSPVLVSVEGSHYRSYFYMPKEYQTYSPKPLMFGIGRTVLPPNKSKIVAVRRFDGSINDVTIPKEFDALNQSLECTTYALAAAGGQYMVAAYTSPMELTDSVNEVFIWL